MSAQLLNNLFKNYFNGGKNDNGNLLVSRSDSSTDIELYSSLSDGEEIEPIKTFKAIYMHFKGEDDDCGMEVHEIQAHNFDDAYKLACEYPGRLYKLTEK